MPTPRYHLAGMGVQGCLTAWALWRGGTPFTWSDPDAPCAWPASSGLIYPTGEPDGLRAYVRWVRWRHGEAPWAEALPAASWTEPAAFWFATRTAPNGLRAGIADDLGALRRTALPSYSLNVPRFVQDTRAFFRAARRPDPAPGAETVRSHGYTPEALRRVAWGWTAQAALALDPRLVASSGVPRPCLYLRAHRFRLLYAIPLPGTARWVVGTSHVTQATPRERPWTRADVAARWVPDFERLTGGLATIAQLDDPVQGWRPMGASDAARAVRRVPGEGLRYPALGGDGVRLAPLVYASIAEALRTSAAPLEV